MTTFHPNGLKETGAQSGEPGITEKAREHIDSQVQTARAATDAARQQIGDSVSQATDESARFVRENPGLALAGAVGVGVLIGLAMRGRG